jgi:predicted acetyltransferase
LYEPQGTHIGKRRKPFFFFPQLVKEFGDPSLSAQTPIACLYPTTPQFYRKFGFEAAGALWNVKIEMSTVCLRGA